MKSQMKIIVAFATLSSFGTSMVFPYIWPYVENVIGLTATISGVLLLSFYGTEATTRIPIGYLSKWFKHSSIVIGAAIAYVIASLFYLSHTLSWYMLFGGQIFLGLGISITWVTIPEFVTRTKGSLPVYTFSVGLGYLAGVTSGGVLVDLLGINKLFTILLGISLGLVLLSILIHKEMANETTNTININTHGESETETSEIPIGISEVFISSFGSFKEAFKLLEKKIEILISCLVSFIMFMTFAIGSSLVPVYLSGIGITSFLIGMILSIRMATSTLIRLATEKILKIGDKVEVLIGGAMITGLSVILFAMTESFHVLAVLSIAWGLGGGLYLPIVFDLIADATTDEERGVAMGLRGTMGTTGSALGTFVFFYLGGKFSTRSSLTWFGILILIFTGILMVLWETQKSRTKNKN